MLSPPNQWWFWYVLPRLSGSRTLTSLHAWQLVKQRVVFKQTRKIVNKVILLTVETGSLIGRIVSLGKQLSS